MDYGVCEIEDILGEVSENTVVVTPIESGDKMIAIPKREQTTEEIERTKLFAKEVRNSRFVQENVKFDESKLFFLTGCRVIAARTSMQNVVQQVCTFLSPSLRSPMSRIGLRIHQVDRIV